MKSIKKRAAPVLEPEAVIDHWLRDVDSRFRHRPPLWVAIIPGRNAAIALSAGGLPCVFSVPQLGLEHETERKALRKMDYFVDHDYTRICVLFGKFWPRFGSGGAVINDDGGPAASAWPLYLTALAFDSVQFVATKKWRDRLRVNRLNTIGLRELAAVEHRTLPILHAPGVIHHAEAVLLARYAEENLRLPE